jgi:hypothetical protein
VPTMSPMYFLVLAPSYSTPSTLNILVPLLLKKIKNHVQPNAIGFFECPFSTPLIFFVVILWFLVDIRIFVLFPILQLSLVWYGCVSFLD